MVQVVLHLCMMPSDNLTFLKALLFCDLQGKTHPVFKIWAGSGQMVLKSLPPFRLCTRVVPHDSIPLAA